MLEAQIRIPTMKNILKGLEAIGEEVILNFDSDGLTATIVDSSITKMFYLKVESDAFEEYSCTADYSYGVVIARMKDITKALTTKDELKIEGDADNLALLANGIRRNIKLLNRTLMSKPPSMPHFNYTYDAEIPALEARNFIKTLGDVLSFNIVIAEAAQTMTWKSESPEEAVEWIPTEVTLNSSQDSVTSYATEHIKLAICATNRETLELRSGDDLPIEFTWAPHEGVRLTSLVAPRT